MPLFNQNDIASRMIMAFSAGQRQRQEAQQLAQEQEDRAIRQDLLKHQLAALKIQDRIQAAMTARKAMSENIGLMEQTSAEDIPLGQAQGPGGMLPSRNLGEGEQALNQWAPVTMPGIEVPDAGINVPPVPVRPRSLEEVMAQRAAQDRLKALTMPWQGAPGTGRMIGGQMIGQVPESNPNVPVFSQSPDKRTLTNVGQVPKNAKIVQEAQPRVSVSLGAPDRDVKDIADGIQAGLDPPQLTGLYRNAKAVRAELNRRGFNRAKALSQWNAAQKFIGNLNSQQMTRFYGLANSVVNTIDEVETLAEQLKQGGVQKWNAAKRSTILQVYGNTPQSALAARYLAAVNTLKEEFANLANGGYAPTEDAWRLANSQINGDYGLKDFEQSLSEVQRLINYRMQGFEQLSPRGTGADNPYYQNPQSATPPPTAGAGLTYQDYLNSRRKK